MRMLLVVMYVNDVICSLLCYYSMLNIAEVQDLVRHFCLPLVLELLHVSVPK